MNRSLDGMETKETKKTNSHGTQIKLLLVIQSDVTSSIVKGCAIVLEQYKVKICFFVLVLCTSIKEMDSLPCVNIPYI